jgi:hypothetical protein
MSRVPRRSNPSRQQVEVIVNSVRVKLGKARVSILEIWRRWRTKEEDAHDAAYRDAVEFRSTLTAREGVEYTWISEYAERQYGWLHEAFSTVDEKANSIIKHLTSGTGLFALGAIALITSRDNALVALTALPAFACGLRAVALAIKARRPAQTDMPPPIKGAVQYAEKFGNDAQAVFLGQWHQACEGMARAVARKSDTVNRAYRWYLAALVLLTFPFLFGIGWRLSHSVQAEKPDAAVIKH